MLIFLHALTGYPHDRPPSEQLRPTPIRYFQLITGCNQPASEITTTGDPRQTVTICHGLTTVTFTFFESVGGQKKKQVVIRVILRNYGWSKGLFS